MPGSVYTAMFEMTGNRCYQRSLDSGGKNIAQSSIGVNAPAENAARSAATPLYCGH